MLNLATLLVLSEIQGQNTMECKAKKIYGDIIGLNVSLLKETQ